MSVMRRPTSSLRHRSGLDLARLNARTKRANHAEILNAILFPVAVVLALAVWVGVCTLVGQ